MKYVVAIMGVAGLVMIGCGGGDGGLEACKEWVAAWNDCIGEDGVQETKLDEGTACPEATFETYASAGCDATEYYTESKDAITCEENVPGYSDEFDNTAGFSC